MRCERLILHLRSLLLAALLPIVLVSPLFASVPSGFQDTTIASGLSQPAGLAFAPDGRLFVAEKTGELRIIKNGALLATPFLDVTQVVAAAADVRRLLRARSARRRVRSGLPRHRRTSTLLLGVQGAGVGDVRSWRRTASLASRAGYQGNPDRADPDEPRRPARRHRLRRRQSQRRLDRTSARSTASSTSRSATAARCTPSRRT